MKPAIDWAVHHQWPPARITCRCGAVFLSHSKHVKHEGRLVGVTETPCPACGSEMDHIYRAEHGPEEMVLRR